MLRFYYVLGGEMEQIKPSFKFGDKFYQMASEDLQKLLPEIKSFSPKNLHYMHKFYQMFASFSNYPQLVAKLDSASESGKFERNFDEICEKVPECIFQIPWGQHKYILDRRSGNPEKALFYVQQTRDMWFCPRLSLVFEFMRLAD